MAYVETLSGADIDFGKALWQALRGNKNFPADGGFVAFPLRTRIPGICRLDSAVNEVGSRKAYAELEKITHCLPANSKQFSRIELISPRQPLYQALRSVFGKTASVEGARLGNTQIDGKYISNAYLYEIR